MANEFPVRYQLVVKTHDGGFHLFEMAGVLPLPPQSGMLLRHIKGIPNVVGPERGFDNVVIRVILSGRKEDGHIETLVQLTGVRAPAENIDEIKASLPEWSYIEFLAKDPTGSGR